MSERTEGDTMECRACGNAERASEGYPCEGCGTFLCLRCSMRGVTLCRTCADKQKPARGTSPA